ncbi:aspartate/tyrosine/aromatic aminotransferase, partial [Rhizobium leguminosarum]
LISEIAKVMDNMQIFAPRSPQIAVASAIPALAEWRAVNQLEIARRAHALRQAFSGLPYWEIVAIGAYFAFIRHPDADRSSS